MMKAAAIIALMIGLVATGYLAYLSLIVRSRYNASVVNCTECTAVKEAVATNWRSVESGIALLKSKGKYREAEKFAHEHAGEQPVNVDVPCADCETPAPDYSRPTIAAAVGFIASALLFGAVKPGR